MVFTRLTTELFKEAAEEILRQTKICEDRGYHRTITNSDRPLETVPLCYDCMDDLTEDSSYRVVPKEEILD